MASSQLIVLVSVIFGLLLLSSDTSAVRHCIYKFRVPVSGMDVSCPGAGVTGEEHRQNSGKHSLPSTPNKPRINYYNKPSDVTMSGDLESDNNRGNSDDKLRNSSKKSNKKYSKKRGDNKKTRLVDQYPPRENLVVNDYSAAAGYRTSTIEKVDDNRVLMDQGTAQQLIQGMAKLVTRSQNEEEVKNANR